MNGYLNKQKMHFMFLAIFCYGMFSMTPMTHAMTLEELRSGLPEKFVGWSKSAEDRIYTPHTIFEYINGGAEVYKAYNMHRCLSRRYAASEGPDIILDIFDMGTAKDAFGVFTHDPQGDVIDLGQDGRLRPGWVNFWKDRFFVSLYAGEETAASQKAVKALAQQVDLLITDRGKRPEIIDRLPTEGLQANSIRYLHHPVILNYHYYLADENLLNLSARTEALLAGYQLVGEEATILLVLYPGASAATRAHLKFSRHYLGEAGKNALLLLENQKWCGAKVDDRLLVIVLESDTRQLAEKLLKSVR
jgi:hypothetical protein